MESENAYNCPIVATFGHYIWKATPSEASKSGTPNLELELRRFCGIEQMPCPLLVIYMLNARISEYILSDHHSLYKDIRDMVKALPLHS